MRKAAAFVAVTLTGLLGWAVIVATTAAVRAPRLNAGMEAARLVPFPPQSLSPSRLCALLEAQDPTFFRHHGIGLFAGHPGHTTLTQAIGKFMLFRDFTPGFLRFRKVELMFAAVGLDRSLPKNTQLRIFLNRVYLGSVNGREVLGFPAAAHSYFGKDLTSLTDAEFFGLLAMLDGPDRYHVLRAPALNRERALALQQRARLRCGL